MFVTWRYPSAVLTAVVASVFSLVVCVALAMDFERRVAKDPLESPEYVALHEQVFSDRDNEQLREKIRVLDIRLREEYFRHRRFAWTGACLLLGGVVVTILAAKSAIKMRPRLPHPVLETTDEDPEAQTAKISRWAVVALAACLAAAAVTLHLRQRSVLPADAEIEIAKGDGSGGAAANGNGDSDGAGSGPHEHRQVADPPSPEEIRRNWPSFRGPSGAGISAYDDVPTTWDGKTGDGIRWKVPVPLPGNSSPVVWEKRLFVSGATKQQREVYCFDADSGDVVWKREVPGTPQSNAKPPEVGETTGYAAPTMASDGRFVFAMFANGDIAAFDVEGNEVWSQSLGVPKSSYGHAASLVTYRDFLIVQYDQGTAKDDKSRLVALDMATGKAAWSVPRAVPNSWSSPILVDHQGTPLIVTCGDPWVIAYSPSDGKEIWRAKCLRQDVGPSPVYGDGVVYVANEFPYLSAIRADGQGDVTDTHVQWTAEFGLPDTSSPLVADEFVLLLASYGTLTCYDASEGGDPLWEEDFDSSFSSSPSLVGNHVYLFGEDGKVWIVEPTREQCNKVSTADLGEDCVTSPAFQEGRIYIRGKEHLFCIGDS